MREKERERKEERWPHFTGLVVVTAIQYERLEPFSSTQ